MTSRAPAEAIAAVQRGGPPITAEERAAAAALLTDLYAVAGRYGHTADDFGWVSDLPGTCVDLVLRKRGDNPYTIKEI